MTKNLESILILDNLPLRFSYQISKSLLQPNFCSTFVSAIMKCLNTDKMGVKYSK